MVRVEILLWFRVFRETGPKLAISAIHRDRDGVSF